MKQEGGHAKNSPDSASLGVEAIALSWLVGVRVTGCLDGFCFGVLMFPESVSDGSSGSMVSSKGAVTLIVVWRVAVAYPPRCPRVTGSPNGRYCQTKPKRAPSITNMEEGFRGYHSETSALLPPPSTHHNLPFLAPILAHIRNIHVDVVLGELRLHSFHTPVWEVSFQLVILLELRRIRKEESLLTGGFGQWHRAASSRNDLQFLDGKINEIWNRFLDENDADHEIETMLWTRFPLDDQNKRYLRGMK